ncbi:hypothetical protein ACSVBT_19645 [Afipia sp. TerB]
MAPLRVDGELPATTHKAVMPGPDPGIHLFSKEMDCRVKPGNDSDERNDARSSLCPVMTPRGLKF